MVLQNIFSNNLIINAKQISRDSKIYEAFKPQLYDVLKISLEDYMSDKELRKKYRYKYLAIKSHFQKKNQRHSFSDEDCLIKITEQGQIWKEFVETAVEHTQDNGKQFLEQITMEKFVVKSAIRKIRSISKSLYSNLNELNQMLDNNTNNEQITHKR